MVYTRKFISSLTKIVNLSFGRIFLVDLIDDIVQQGEERVIDDLAVGKYWCGKSLIYQDLLTVDNATFTRMLEYAAIYAIMSWFNQNGKNNQAVGPINSVSGDGMAKTQSYYISKGANPDSLVNYEDMYIAKIKDIYRVYAGKVGRPLMMKRFNEHYDLDFNANYESTRKTNGNT